MLISAITASTCFGVLWQCWWVPSENQRQAVQLINSRWNAGGVEFGEYRYEPMDDFPWWKRTAADWFGKDAVARVTLAFSEGTGEMIDISCWKQLPSVERVGFDRAIIDDLSALKGFKALKEFYVYQAGVLPTSEKPGLEVLGTCPQLESIKLTSCKFPMNDDVLNSICDASQIREFHFEPRDCTNLSPLRRLSKLEELSLTIWPSTKAKVTNLQAIGDLFQLKRLTIVAYRDKPGDYSFSFVKQLKQLEECWIQANLTPEQRQEISELLPSACEISFE